MVEHSSHDVAAAPVDDGHVIDITDAAVARMANDDLIIDLRDQVIEAGQGGIATNDLVIDLRALAPTGRRLAPGAAVSGRPPDLEPGLHLVTIEDGAEWDKAERFVYDTYIKLGYTKESSTNRVEELQEYADRSHFHAAVDGDGDIVGTTRGIYGSFEQLPVGKFERIDFDDVEPMCELSSIVVCPERRSTGVIEHLYRRGWSTAIRRGARTIAGLGERWMIDGFRLYYCLPFIPCGKPQYYMGGPVIPMTMATHAEAMAEVVIHNPDFWLWNIEVLTDEELDAFGFRELAELKVPEHLLTRST